MVPRVRSLARPTAAAMTTTTTTTTTRRLLSTSTTISHARALNAPLSATTDAELFDIFEREKQRQRKTIALIASENFAPRIVYDCLGSVMSNKYSEGYPGARYYSGNEFIDQCERLCQRRALEAFRLDPAVWGVNVQPLSGSPANFQVYTALLRPHDRIMGLDLSHGGHLSHGFFTAKKRISATSIFFESMPYRLDESTGLIDYDALDRNAGLFRPQLIIAGTSAYSRLLDYARFRRIADAHQAILMADMAHVSGLVAGGVIPSPFEFADVVTTTTHKSLRGPRGAMIFYRKVDRASNKPVDWGEKIDAAVFPGLQGGPHNHTIAALAAALKLCTTPEYRAYQERVVGNAKALASALQAKGFKVVSGGTDNHVVLVDVKSSHGVDGARTERVLDVAGIVTNKNTVPGDASALVPGGIRLGTPAFTTRGADKSDFEAVAGLLARGVQEAKRIAASKELEGKKLADFKKFVDVKSSAELHAKFPELARLKKDVEALAMSLPTVGFDESEMTFRD